ncbi:hypothetical protein FRC03_011492 [Tulasnella sp. 419]|nr:hypothetical protein FRC02_008054 [Tulasnella sp. 418]KAG8954332.1 hypothetical protein FRC03_011492 [Tulasnella sp. 419]
MQLAGGRTDAEEEWAKRFKYLEAKGYRLRPRYRPDWKPSWIMENGEENSRARYDAEDRVMIWYDFILDAERIKDGMPVMLKRIISTSPEVSIGRYLSSPELRDIKENHSVPLLDVVDDPLDPDYSILVLPLLRRIEYPTVQTIGECVDFMQQMLEGLVFLHDHEISHRDCAKGNIMMDARRLFPEGWHPMEPVYLPDLRPAGPGLSRTKTGGVRYYFIDFGLASQGESLVLGQDGQERAPELETGDETHYNPFRLDVYILGKAFEEYMLQKHRGAEFVVRPLVNSMTATDPKHRPTAKECLDRLRGIAASLSPSVAARPLRRYDPNKESVFVTLVTDFLTWTEDFWRKPAEEPADILSLTSYWL